MSASPPSPDLTATLDLAIPRPLDANERRPSLTLVFSELGARRAQRRNLEGVVELGRGRSILGLGPLVDNRVSRSHARIAAEKGDWAIEDLGSRNGTFVNGQPLRGRRPLAEGDLVRVGDTLLVYSERGVPGDDQTNSSFVGISGAASRVRSEIKRIAPLDITVMILGETGTGKEVVARALHEGSGRSGAFVALNCAALPAQLLESELFGHEAGAFTGAAMASAGLFRQAHGGTLFLDELGEMPLPLQAKLLRVLETRRVRPLGSGVLHEVDARILAATHQDVLRLVEDGRFRLDLYGRLAQWTLHLEPLAARREDVALLAMRFSLERGRRSVEPDLMEALILTRWPLNVRGLRTLIHVAAIESPPGPLALGPRTRATLEENRGLGDNGRSKPNPMPRGEVPDEDNLVDALRTHRGRVADVARSLGASRQQVYRWLDTYGLTAGDFRG